jgi:hypothetical protein
MAATINCPHVVSVAADGTANLEAIMLESYSLAPAVATFTVNAPLSDNIFAAFTIAEGASDASADYVVSMTESTFSQAVKDLALAAKLSTDPTKSMSAWLLDEAKGSIETRLNANGISSSAEAEVITNIAHAGFGDDVKTGTDGMALALNGSQDKKNLLLAQFPKARFDVSDAAIAVLPYAIGDKFVVQFNITQEIALTTGSTLYDGTGSLGVQQGTQISKVTPYGIDPRVVNLEVTVA